MIGNIVFRLILGVGAVRHDQGSSVEAKARSLKRKMHEELQNKANGNQPRTEYSDSGGEGTALVMVNGSGMVKAGFAGDDAPRAAVIRVNLEPEAWEPSPGKDAEDLGGQQATFETCNFLQLA